MRKVLAAALVALALVAGAPGAAHATPQPKFAADFRGTSVFDFSTPACSFVHQTFRAKFIDSLGGTGTFLLDGCVNGSTFAFDGKFRLNSASGTRRGRVGGTVSNSAKSCPNGGFPSDLDFMLTSRVGDPIHLLGLWCSPVTPGVEGPIRGTLTA
jgi:hypothetical protein